MIFFKVLIGKIVNMTFINYTAMTLDEAIQHCKEKSCGNTECAKEHKQLGEWLTELKCLRSSFELYKERTDVLRKISDNMSLFNTLYAHSNNVSTMLKKRK